MIGWEIVGLCSDVVESQTRVICEGHADHFDRLLRRPLSFFAVTAIGGNRARPWPALGRDLAERGEAGRVSPPPEEGRERLKRAE